MGNVIPIMGEGLLAMGLMSPKVALIRLEAQNQEEGKDEN